MTLASRAERLTIYLSEAEHHGRIPEFVEIVEKARESGLAGATVVQGIEGFGSSAQVHRWQALHVTEDVPVTITVVDSPENIDRFLADVDHLIERGLVLRQPVEVVLHRTGDSDPSRPRHRGFRRQEPER